MSELRWIIGLVGLGVIVALYFWGRSRAAARHSKETSGRVEPSIDQVAGRESGGTLPPMSSSERGWMQFPEPEVRRQPDASSSGSAARTGAPGKTAAAPVAPQKILVLHVRAAAGEDFTGPSLLEALEGEGLTHGQYDAFHYLNDQGESVYTVVNMMEPGTFPIDDMGSFSTVGITAFMILPGPGKADDLARMIASCRRLASRLGGEVLDESRSTLTNQGATHMREELIEFLRQSRLGPLA